MHPFVGGQELPAAPAVANQEFSIDQFVPRHFSQFEESGQLGRIRRPAATIRRSFVWATAFHDAWARREPEAPYRAEPEVVRKPRGVPALLGPNVRSPYPWLPRKPPSPL
jgi:hypothetical protein